jgi:uncharacterized protein GlcG (DUF336 family)
VIVNRRAQAEVLQQPCGFVQFLSIVGRVYPKQVDVRFGETRHLQSHGAPILCIEIAQNKAYTALFGVSTQDLFHFIQGDPSLLAGMPTLARMAAWGGGFPIKVGGEIVGAIGVSGAPTVQNDVDCARAALALVPDAVPVGAGSAASAPT